MLLYCFSHYFSLRFTYLETEIISLHHQNEGYNHLIQQQQQQQQQQQINLFKQKLTITLPVLS